MNENTNEHQTSTCLAITNSDASVLTLNIEPWADQYEVPVGQTLELVVEGPTCGFLQIEVLPKALTIYGWPGSTISPRPLKSEKV